MQPILPIHLVARFLLILLLARLFAKPANVLVLDEPTFGQDARTWESMVELLAEVRAEGHAIVAVTHDELFVRMMADIEYAMVRP